ncbi:MAG: glycosyltransferase [Chitinophagales bacterium]|nr:glycosyltransferase [Chitinophagales bacterium]
MSDKKTKITCLVINDLNTDQRMHRICGTLSTAGYDVTLVGRILPSSAELSTQSFQQVRLKCFWNSGFLFYFEYNIRLLFWLLFHKSDIINAIDLDTIIPAFFMAKLKGKKVVYDAHEWFPYCPELTEKPKVKGFWQKVEKIFVPRMDKVYTVSQSIAHELSTLCRQDVKLVRNMPWEKSLSNTEKKKYLLYQGALNIGRGLEAMIDAMHEIKIPLYIAGKGDIENDLKQRVKSQHLEDKVIFLGNLKPDILWTYTQEAMMGINLLENTCLNYYYSLANKFFDYVQAEIPQISMNFPEYQKMNQEFEVAVLLDELTPKAIVKSISDLIENKEKYTYLSEQCRYAKAVWNWENEQKALIAIYEQL